MKKFLLLAVAMIMFFTLSITTYAEDKIIDETEVDKVLELSLDQAIKYALIHSRDVKIQELDIKRAELKYDQDRMKLRDYRNNKELIEAVESANREEKAFFDPEILAMVDQIEYFDLGIIERQANLAKQISIWNKEIKENEIKYNVEKAYFDLLQSEIDMEIAKEGLELANRQYGQSKKMYELGSISFQQLLSVELAVAQAQSTLDMAIVGYELQKMNFNNTLGLPLDQKVILTDKIEYKEHDEIKLEEAIETAHQNSAMLKVAKENYELSELTFKAVRAKYSTPNQYKYREQEIAVEQAAKNFNSAQNGLEMAVRSAYYSLITAEKQIKTFEKAVENAQKAYELTELSYNLGQNTSNDVTKARIDLMDAKKNLSKQIHAYNLALLDFKYSIGLGKNIISGGL